MKKRVAVLGATGSIGTSTLETLRRGKEDFEAVLLSAHTKARELAALGREFPGALLVLSGMNSSNASSLPEEDRGKIAYFGKEGLLHALAECGADITVNGITGAAGLEPSLAAVKAGSDLALANKETVVLAFPLVSALAKEKQVRILPVDSEHAAIFRLLEAHGKGSAEELLLTASGGPFRTYSALQLAAVSPREALAHPTWRMGPKITLDSATLANKGLEVIEAVRLFDFPKEKVKVVIHPQSIVHSMIRLKDGALYAQMSRPDMRLPIHEALYWPRIVSSPFGSLNFDALTLEFEKPDYQKFPLLPLAYDAAGAGGVYPAVYNAANEAAAAAFLEERIGFLDIPRIVQDVLEKDWYTPSPDLETILDADKRAGTMALLQAASL
ncbi:MAG: 1-deoxy-D-xylulose-5-phosphate reductoisomerase [Treponema sp.]|jgi:1-deoxy-D-xylulose-5-phosphate reductoisomerase|nr:1-deoxy-D-xylulose-5-phosphate reductoisomerase [Treponema sp.]